MDNITVMQVDISTRRCTYIYTTYIYTHMNLDEFLQQFY